MMTVIRKATSPKLCRKHGSLIVAQVAGHRAINQKSLGSKATRNWAYDTTTLYLYWCIVKFILLPSYAREKIIWGYRWDQTPANLLGVHHNAVR